MFHALSVLENRIVLLVVEVLKRVALVLLSLQAALDAAIHLRTRLRNKLSLRIPQPLSREHGLPCIGTHYLVAKVLSRNAPLHDPRLGRPRLKRIHVLLHLCILSPTKSLRVLQVLFSKLLESAALLVYCLAPHCVQYAASEPTRPGVRQPRAGFQHLDLLFPKRVNFTPWRSSSVWVNAYFRFWQVAHGSKLPTWS